MNYKFDFDAVLASWDYLLEGAWLTVQLSFGAMAIGLVVAILCALGKTSGPKPVRWLINAYIEVIRNTPFLVQIFLIFFGLPTAAASGCRRIWPR
ncbi:ABC transporter permease subunit [Azospirillum canadense]|uniref:ABC transporter permease subunit n=1 Tax=Azospirillum canadense TaxID=403962 RepID=UPI0022260B80|nr:ABC transporter permease subunit [Azospirillum canadense]MCW2243083.1 His/Glu/Gln/Arg/opine family amino acid ABC transporter permease subunit [Azospirillum canadense]